MRLYTLKRDFRVMLSFGSPYKKYCRDHDRFLKHDFDSKGFSVFVCPACELSRKAVQR